VHIFHVSVGRPQEIEFEGRLIRTSIFKTLVDGKVPVRLNNIDGDEQSDPNAHGGRNKAVYVYSRDYYDDWARELGIESLQTSQFGENLTVSGCRDTEVRIGSRYRFGEVEATVTQPRLPCPKIGLRLGDKNFPKTFWNRGRLGFYVRIDREGMLGAGDAIELIEPAGHDITIRKLFDILRNGESDEVLRAIDTLPHLDDGWLRRLRQIARRRGAASD
jgi:MOSC domain-containing protein YiiM